MAKMNGQLILEEDYDEHYEPTEEGNVSVFNTSVFTRWYYMGLSA